MAIRNASSEAKMSTPAVASAVLHASVLAVAFLGLPDLFRSKLPLEPEPVMVEFEKIDKKAAAPTVGNPPPQPKDAPIAQETTKAPPPKTADPPPAPEQPKPQLEQAVAPPPPPLPTPEVPKAPPPKPQEDVVAMKPKEPEQPKVEKPPEPPKPTPEVKKPDPPKPPPPPKPAPPTRDKADAVLDDILKNKSPNNTQKTPEQQPKPPQQVTRQAPQAPQLAAVVTASEVDAIKAAVGKCWLQTPGLKNLDTIVVSIVVDMNPNATPAKATLVDMGRYNNDPVFRSVADAGLRAVMNPRCHPWPMPMDKQSGWRTVTFNFSPRDFQ